MPSLNPSNELSLYQDEIADQQYVKTQLKNLIAAYPKVSNDFIILLTDRVVENRFTKNRIKDAINTLIDNFRYEMPKVADIISFDRRYKLYTYYEVIDKVNEGMKFEEFERQENGRYICKAEI